jgi:hypothetical protein
MVRDDAGNLSVPFRLAPAESLVDGEYRLVLLNVVDLWGNPAADLPAPVQPSFRLVP